MKPVMQTKFGDEGNCYSACIASLLEIDLSNVPNFAKRARDATGFWSAVRKWLAKKNMALVFIDWPLDSSRIPAFYENVIFIFFGKSPRSNRQHACIGKVVDGKYVQLHDPHPDGTGFDGEPVMINRIFKVDRPQ